METKRKSFHHASVHLPVKNLRETLDYYRDVLGFYDEWVWENKDGGARRDELRVLFGEDSDFVNRINGHKSRLNVLWFVNNIAEIYDEYQSRKIDIASPLTDYPYKLREFAFVDVNGYYIRLAENAE